MYVYIDAHRPPHRAPPRAPASLLAPHGKGPPTPPEVFKRLIYIYEYFDICMN